MEQTELSPFELELLSHMDRSKDIFIELMVYHQKCYVHTPNAIPKRLSYQSFKKLLDVDKISMCRTDLMDIEHYTAK